MPRPESVTAADIERWRDFVVEAERMETDPGGKALLGRCLADPVLTDRVFNSGAWLGEQLTALGCPRDLMNRICFAHGQRVHAEPDAWALAEQELAEYRAGRWQEPGPELAKRVFAKQFPGLADRRRRTP